MTQGRCMRIRGDVAASIARAERHDYPAQSLAKLRESAGHLLSLHDCQRPVRKPEPTQAERRSLAASKKPRQRTAYGPSDYARSVPAEVRGTRSTKGVTIIHTGRNRDARRADAAYAEHTTYVPRTNDVARLGERAKRKRAASDANATYKATQEYAAAEERKLRVVATKARNARIAAVVAGIETDTATWK